MPSNTSLIVAALLTSLNTAPASVQEVIAAHEETSVTSSSTSTINHNSAANNILPPVLDTESDENDNSTSTATNSSNNPTVSVEEAATWDALAQCESSGDWSINTGNGFYGGLQFTPQTWAGFGGTKYASSAHLATREQQIDIAKKVQATQGWGAWPACTAKLGYR